jgi:hypothetical protein
VSVPRILSSLLFLVASIGIAAHASFRLASVKQAER